MKCYKLAVIITQSDNEELSEHWPSHSTSPTQLNGVQRLHSDESINKSQVPSIYICSNSLKQNRALMYNCDVSVLKTINRTEDSGGFSLIHSTKDR